MYIRLAFAVQTCIDPDILILDEILSVGDIFFQQKCYARLDELLSRNTAVIMVSHDMAAIEKYSTRTLLLNKGKVEFMGQPNEAVQRFYLLETRSRGFASQTPTTVGTKPTDSKNITFDFFPPPSVMLPLADAGILGGEKAICTGVALFNQQNQPQHIFHIGETMVVYAEFQLLADIDVPIVGVTLTNAMNINVHGKNSAQGLLDAPTTVQTGSTVRMRQAIKLDIGQGLYTFSVGFSTLPATAYAHFAHMAYAKYHQLAEVLTVVQNAGSLTVVLPAFPPDLPFHGIADLDNDFQIETMPPTNQTPVETGV
jgi:lipopolysaccharide transport system ATP-binding protein